VINDGGDDKEDKFLRRLKVDSGELRNKKVAEPWMIEVNDERNSLLPSSEVVCMNIDGSFLRYKTRIGNGYGLSREYQYQFLIERKWINEELDFKQLDQLYKLHAKMITPYQVIRKGERDLQNYGTSRHQGVNITNFGCVVLRMDGLTIKTSTRFIWERIALRSRRARGGCKYCHGFGNPETEPRNGIKFETTDQSVIWDLLNLKLNPDDPKTIWNDRLHHTKPLVINSRKRSELGFDYDEERDFRS
jgi:hypothetical protein